MLGQPLFEQRAVGVAERAYERLAGIERGGAQRILDHQREAMPRTGRRGGWGNQTGRLLTRLSARLKNPASTARWAGLPVTCRHWLQRKFFRPPRSDAPASPSSKDATCPSDPSSPLCSP